MRAETDLKSTALQNLSDEVNTVKTPNKRQSTEAEV